MKGITRRKIAAILIVSWFVILIYAFIMTTTPTITYSPYPDQSIFPAPCNPKAFLTAGACSVNSSIPPTFVTLYSSFTAKGVFSAENPIRIHCLLDANRSDFLHYYRGISFLGATFTNGTSQGVFLSLTQAGNGEYQANGTLQWATETDVYWFLVPQPNYFTTFLLGPHSNTTSVILYVSPVQDTLTMKFNDITERLTYVVIAFSVIVLQPILEALLVDDRKKSSIARRTEKVVKLQDQ